MERRDVSGGVTNQAKLFLKRSLTKIGASRISSDQCVKALARKIVCVARATSMQLVASATR
jgi:hypothetical protein